MNLSSVITNKIQASLGAFILTFIFILREYFNGGVITHHLLAREDLPGFSNWWGLLSVPLLFWISITLINKRQNQKSKSEATAKKSKYLVLKRFLAALVFSTLISLLWEFKLEAYLQYIILFPFVIALFKPVHFPEYFMGFVLGLVFTFGGILPLIIGLVLLTISFLINKIVSIIRNLVSTAAH